MASTSDYLVSKSGFIAGRRVSAGEPVRLTPAQAKYAHVTPAPAAKAPRRRATEVQTDEGLSA